jgi:hypothetical protein
MILIQAVCPMPRPPGWANVYTIHAMGHMILTEAELLAASNWL